jgi:hypothetical protein
MMRRSIWRKLCRLADARNCSYSELPAACRRVNAKARRWRGSIPLRRMKSDLPARHNVVGRIHEFLERVEHERKLVIVPHRVMLELLDLVRERRLVGDELPEPHEGSHDRNVHLNGAAAGEDRREHGDALFREYERELSSSAVPRT